MLSLAVVLIALGSFACTHVSYSKSSSVVGVSTEKLLSPRLSSGKGCGSDRQLLHVSPNESSSLCFPTERGIPCVPTIKFHRSKGSIFQPEPKAYYELQHRAATNSSGGIIAGSCCGGILFFLAVFYFLWRILREDQVHPAPPPPPPPCVC